jgi:hypothetical protein
MDWVSTLPPPPSTLYPINPTTTNTTAITAAMTAGLTCCFKFALTSSDYDSSPQDGAAREACGRIGILTPFNKAVKRMLPDSTRSTKIFCSVARLIANGDTTRMLKTPLHGLDLINWPVKPTPQ